MPIDLLFIQVVPFLLSIRRDSVKIWQIMLRPKIRRIDMTPNVPR